MLGLELREGEPVLESAGNLCSRFRLLVKVTDSEAEKKEGKKENVEKKKKKSTRWSHH